jgi:TonB family protein
MEKIDANRILPGYELKDELARFCLPSASRDANLKLAWVNSICILFLLIGIIGARRGLIAIKPVPPIQEIIPVVIQPAVLPPQTIAPRPEPAEVNNQPPVLVVLPDAPNINFGVPTAGTLVMPAALASAPPPQEAPARIGSLNNTGEGGDRPEPPYPAIARETGEQGTVKLLLGGDAAGNVVSVEVRESSGFPILDRATVDFIKRHWRLPAGEASHFFETSITYLLQLN